MSAQTLMQYLEKNLANDVIDHAVRARLSADGGVVFYIRPAGNDGDTLDFSVEGNALTALGQPAQPGSSEMILEELRKHTGLLEKIVLQDELRQIANGILNTAPPTCGGSIRSKPGFQVKLTMVSFPGSLPTTTFEVIQSPGVLLKRGSPLMTAVVPGELSQKQRQILADRLVDAASQAQLESRLQG